jgi:hypothetical protein
LIKIGIKFIISLKDRTFIGFPLNFALLRNFFVVVSAVDFDNIFSICD